MFFSIHISSEYSEIVSLLLFNGFDPPAAAALSLCSTVSNTSVFQDTPVLRLGAMLSGKLDHHDSSV